MKKLTEIWFKHNADGSVIFYPYGIFGGGFLLSKEREKRIKCFLEKCNVLIITLIFLSFFVKIYLVLLIAIVSLSIYFFRMRFLLINQKRVIERIDFKTAASNAALATGFLGVIVLVIFSAVGVCASIIAIFRGGSIIICFLGIVLFGLCLAYFLYMLIILIKK